MPSNALLIDDEDIYVGKSNPGPRSVLVIEGDPLVARSLELILTAEAFVVKMARDGAEGVDLARRASYDLIVMGADLPDMSGLEAMKQLRLAEVKAAMVFASLTSATAASAATLHLSDCS